MPKNQKKEFIDWEKLSVPEIKEKYLIDVKNKYEILSMETDTQEENVCESERKWNCFKNSVLYANENAPKSERKINQVWMTDEILSIMDKRKMAKNSPEYKKYDQEIGRKC